MMKTLEAEFPTWQLVNAFSVFDLAGTTEALKRGPGTEDALAKLAKVCQVPLFDLKREYVSLLPTAMALQKQGGLQNRAAWAEALNRLDERSSTRRKYPSANLKKASFFFCTGVIKPLFCHIFFWLVSVRRSQLGSPSPLPAPVANKTFRS